MERKKEGGMKKGAIISQVRVVFIPNKGKKGGRDAVEATKTGIKKIEEFRLERNLHHQKKKFLSEFGIIWGIFVFVFSFFLKPNEIESVKLKKEFLLAFALPCFALLASLVPPPAFLCYAMPPPLLNQRILLPLAFLGRLVLSSYSVSRR